MTIEFDPTTIGRTTWFCDAIDDPVDPGATATAEQQYRQLEKRTAAPYEDANLVSSRVGDDDSNAPIDGWHAPALDIDVPAALIPSSTPGHHHLYFDTLMTWEDYHKLLRVMAEVGLIESGYVLAAEARKATMLRKPGHHKVLSGPGRVDIDQLVGGTIVVKRADLEHSWREVDRADCVIVVHDDGRREVYKDTSQSDSLIELEPMTHG